jgi:hypothetical protein
LPSEPTTPLRHSGIPPSFGGKVPFPSPHLSSAESHTPLRQTRLPFGTVQVPPIGAVAGNGKPFASFGSHTPAASHHAVAEQSASVEQVGEQAPLMQYGPRCVAPAQSAFVAQVPQLPPLVGQYPALDSGHGCTLATPKSEVHAAHRLEVASQNGVGAVHAEPFVAVHCTQWFVMGLHAGVAPEQLPSA